MGIRTCQQLCTSISKPFWLFHSSIQHVAEMGSFLSANQEVVTKEMLKTQLQNMTSQTYRPNTAASGSRKNTAVSASVGTLSGIDHTWCKEREGKTGYMIILACQGFSPSESLFSYKRDSFSDCSCVVSTEFSESASECKGPSAVLIRFPSDQTKEYIPHYDKLCVGNA